MLPDPPGDRRSRVGALLSGAFNPVHDGHRGLAAAAAAFLRLPVSYELPVVNADKSPLDAAEAHRRAAQFLGRAELWLTRAALYADKAALFPGAVFVVGADTAERVLQPRFYGGERQMTEAVTAIGAAGCRFLVAARPLPSGLLTLGRLQRAGRAAGAVPGAACRPVLPGALVHRHQGRSCRRGFAVPEPFRWDCPDVYGRRRTMLSRMSDV